MNIHNPFQNIDQRLTNIESLLLELKHSNQPIKKEENLTVDEVAEFLKVSKQSVYSYIKKGTLKAKRVNRSFLISRADLEEATKDVKSLKYQRES